MESLKSLLRNCIYNKTTTIIKIAGLTVSTAAALIIWAFIISENRYDSGIQHSNRIYRLEAQWASMPPFIGHVINQNLGNEVVAARMNFWSDVGVQVDNFPFNLQDLVFADSTFFNVIPFDFSSGDPRDALINPFSIVLSESVAKKLFGTTDVVGRILKMENQYDFTVTGVIKDNPFMHLRIESIASIVSLEKIASPGVLQAFDGWSYPTYLLLPENSNPLEYETKIQKLLLQFRYGEGFHLRPFEKIYYSSEVENESNTRHGNLLHNRILIAVSVFILLLAAVNFINLTIAGAVSRSKEVYLRRLHGASQIRLTAQFMAEVTFLILFSVVLSFFLLWFFNPLLQQLTEFSVNTSLFLTGVNAAILSAAIIAFVFIAGIYPSLYISTFGLNKEKVPLSGHQSIRNSLIVFQNLVSITLICCTLVANRQFSYMSRKDLGFSKENVIILKLNSELKTRMDLFRQKLQEIPGIAGISYTSRIPGTYWGSWCCVNIEGKENKYFNNYVDPFYLQTLGITLKQGRDFSAEDPADIKTKYLINETAIKEYDLKNPIGQFISPGNGIKGEIIGIIKDFNYRGLQYEQTPLLLFNTPDYKNYVNIRLSASDIDGSLQIIKAVWEDICPSFTFNYKFLDATYDLQYRTERKFENQLFSFALLALFIAGIGLLGISIFSTERRTKEIGIRKVNGATVSEIISMLIKDILSWIVIAFLISCPVAWYVMSGWLKNFAFRTNITPWIFVISAGISFGVAAVTVTLQSLRAAAKNPVKTLRYE